MQLNKLFRTPKNQVSTPRPECGVGFDSSARAMNRSASKGSLMVHEYSHTTPAVKGILSFATFSERKHMLKTLKRKIALVAVAGLGAGLVSVAPASAAPAAATSVAVTPVRVTTTAAAQDSVPAATLSFVSPNAITAADVDAFTLTVTSAPTSTARVGVQGTAANKGFYDTLAAGPVDLGTTTLATDILAANVTAGGTVKFPISVTSTAPGTYSGTLLISDADADDILILGKRTGRDKRMWSDSCKATFKD